MGINRYYKFLNLLILSVVVVVLFSCIAQKESNQFENENSLLTEFNEIKDVDIDSLFNMYASWRYSRLLSLRFFYKNDTKGIGKPLSVYKTDENKLVFKPDNKWITIDSLNVVYPYKDFGFSCERVKYCYNFMSKNGVKEIISHKDADFVNISKENNTFCYIKDFKNFREKHSMYYNLENIEGNWWYWKRKTNH